MEYVTLATVPLSTCGVIVDVHSADGPRRRLAEIGLRPGAQVTVLRRTGAGGRIVAVAGSRIALDKGTAGELTVRVGGA